MTMDLIKKENGVVFTPSDLAAFMAKRAVKLCKKKKDEQVVVLEPSSGDGNLAIEMIRCLFDHGYNRIKLVAFDINEAYLTKLRNKVTSLYPLVEVETRCEDFVSFSWSCSTPFADLIISNPPYVRTQHLSDEYVTFATNQIGLNGRVDLYHIFLCLLPKVLNPDGAISIVVSNKFLSNKTGLRLRNFLFENYDIQSIIDFGDTKLFDAAVLPVVLILNLGKTENLSPQYISIYSDSASSPSSEMNGLFEAIESSAKIALHNGVCYSISSGHLNCSSGNWSIASDENDSFLSEVERETFCILRDIAKIKVGVKTTADNVFISDAWNTMGSNKPELLRPLITHKLAGHFFSSGASTFEILYPYYSVSKKRIVVELDDYPLTKAYLEKHRAQLERRKYVVDSNKQWFEIWVPHSPYQWDKPKIIFRDICEHPTFWLDAGGSVVNGDCYWMDFNNETNEEMIWLTLAVCNSSFIEKYYDLRFNNKIYAGRRRFMSQYVEQFPLPDPRKEASQKVIELCRKIYTSKEYTKEIKERLDALVFDCFNLPKNL